MKHIFKTYNFEYVFHFAAYAAVGMSPFIRKFNYENNIISTMEIINNCVNYNVKRLVYTSSMDVYGVGDGISPFDENDTPLPLDPYGIAKYACELDIKNANLQHGLNYCIIRPHNCYGINQNIYDAYRNVFGIWMYRYLNNKSLFIYGDGEQERNFTYIDDILPCLWNAATYEKALNQVINLGGTETHTINDACNILINVMGGGNIEYKEHRVEVKHAVPTFQKSIDLLDFKQENSLKDGLTKMWEWVKKLPIKDIKKMDNYLEIKKGLYSYWK